MAILTILILPIQEHGILFHFVNHLQFLFLNIFIVFRVCLSLPWLGLFQSIFDAILDNFFFFFSFLFLMFYLCKEMQHILYLNIYPATLLN